MAVRTEDRDYIREIGRAVGEVRHRCGLSQTELAKRIGMSMQTVRGIENGVPRTVNYLLMRRVAEALYDTKQIVDPVDHVLRFLMRETESITFVFRMGIHRGGGGIGSTGEDLDIPGYDSPRVEPSAA